MNIQLCKWICRIRLSIQKAKAHIDYLECQERLDKNLIARLRKFIMEQTRFIKSLSTIISSIEPL